LVCHATRRDGLLEVLMDFNFSEEDEKFRREFRSWLEQNIPRDWRDDSELADPIPRPNLKNAARGIAPSTTRAGCASTGPKNLAGAAQR
jgi:hypothetical protein